MPSGTSRRTGASAGVSTPRNRMGKRSARYQDDPEDEESLLRGHDESTADDARVDDANVLNADRSIPQNATRVCQLDQNGTAGVSDCVYMLVELFKKRYHSIKERQVTDSSLPPTR